MIHTDSALIHNDSSPIQADSSMIHSESARIKPPQWYEFEAATPVNQRFKGLRVAGFICCAVGAVVVIYMSRPPKAGESVAARFEECIKKDKKRRSEVDRK